MLNYQLLLKTSTIVEIWPFKKIRLYVYYCLLILLGSIWKRLAHGPKLQRKKYFNFSATTVPSKFTKATGSSNVTFPGLAQYRNPRTPKPLSEIKMSIVSVFHRITAVPCHPPSTIFTRQLFLRVCLRKSNTPSASNVQDKRRQIKRASTTPPPFCLRAILRKGCRCCCCSSIRGYTSVHLGCLFLKKRTKLCTKFSCFRRVVLCRDCEKEI